MAAKYFFKAQACRRHDENANFLCTSMFSLQTKEEEPKRSLKPNGEEKGKEKRFETLRTKLSLVGRDFTSTHGRFSPSQIFQILCRIDEFFN